MTFEEFDIVILTQATIYFRAGAKLVVLEVKDGRIRVGISASDSGEWVNKSVLEKVC